MKFTEDGGRVELSTRVVDEAVVIEVADNGIGMEPDEQRHVFGRFTRAPRAQSMAIPGTGLGLCLVDAIVREHGGQVLVESETGVGSVFSILLPAAPLAAAEVSA